MDPRGYLNWRKSFMKREKFEEKTKGQSKWIERAIKMIADGVADRMDGEGIKAYLVPAPTQSGVPVIRIDVPVETKEE